MSESDSVVVLFAGSVSEERERFSTIIQDRGLPYTLLLPEDMKSAGTYLESGDVDAIVTDLDFGSGAMVDWLSLWPRPFILLAYYGEERRVEELVRDEASACLMRDPAFRHLGTLPGLISKVLGIRESLDRQNAHLQISERQYLDLMQALPDIVYTLDGDGRFIFVNDSVSQLGYNPQELIGKHFSYILDEEELAKVSRDAVLSALAPGHQGPIPSPKLFDERRSGKRMTRDLVVRLRCAPRLSDAAVAKLVAYGEVSSVGFRLPEYQGLRIGTVGILRDVSIRQEAERRLRNDLHVRELMLKETYHRVKNNLQVVASLLSLHGSAMKDPESAMAFMNCEAQIQSMAMVHDELYRAPDSQTINMEPFLERLTDYLFSLFDAVPATFQKTVRCEGVSLNAEQAIPVGLVVNELLSAWLVDGDKSRVAELYVSLERIGPESLRLSVAFPSGYGTVSREDGASTGLQLVDALASQLRGTGSWSEARYSLDFPLAPSEASGQF